MIENDPLYNTIYEDDQEKCDGEARHVGKDAEVLKTMQESAMVQSSKWIARVANPLKVLTDRPHALRPNRPLGLHLGRMDVRCGPCWGRRGSALNIPAVV